jgi:predicted AAA+ superfamily ATPase
VLLLGPRRVGKSAFIRNELRADRVYDLLHADVFQRLATRPSLLREELRPTDRVVAIDEVQKLPALLDEVHACIEEHRVRFLLSGSSARKLRRSHPSLMAGRAKTCTLGPFVSAEVPELDLDRALLFGMLPPVLFSDDPWDELGSYAGQYLQEEIRAEALARNVEAFSRFLHVAALANATVLSFESVARDAQVPARTVREYFQVLADTLVGHLLPPLAAGGGRAARKAISHAKFYLFDLGVTHRILGRRALPVGSDEYGRAFESFLALELLAWCAYRGQGEELRFYRTRAGVEVDFVLGDVGIEAKAGVLATERDARGLCALEEVHPLRRRLIVSRDPTPRRFVVRGAQIEVLPWAEFLGELWAGGV